jgi:hypothetical protein
MRSAKYDVICHAPQVGSCGLHCKHCWVTDNLKEHKPLREVKQMINAIAELREEPALAKTTILYFLDELTLHPDVIEILRYCRKRDVLPQRVLVSNGHGLATRGDWKEILGEFKKCGLIGFLMTINGDKEYHDWFTGSKGAFEKTVEATRRANEYGFKVKWNMYLTNENVKQIVESARMKGDHRILISVPVKTTRWSKWSHIHPDISVFSEIPDDLKQYIGNDYKSEKEWINLINNDKLPVSEETEEGEGQVKYIGYYECNDELYTNITLPEYKVAELNYDKFRELYSSGIQPYGVEAEKNIDLKEMARKYGDPSSTRAFSLSGLKREYIHNHSMNQTPASE